MQLIATVPQQSAALMACVFDVDGVILNTPLEGADRVEAFPDALRFLDAVSALGWPLAVVSSSHDANEMMRGIRLPSGKALLDVFAANLCIPDFASAELRVPTSREVVMRMRCGGPALIWS